MLTEFGSALIASGQKDRGCDMLKRAGNDKRARSLYEKEGCDLVSP